MAAFRSSSSTKVSAWRRNSSAIIGGLLRKLEMTVTRTPRRCTASSSEQKSPSPENSIMLSTWFAISRASTASSTRMLRLNLAPTLAIVELFCWFRNHGKAIVGEPIDQRTDREIFMVFKYGGVIERAHQRAAVLEFG